MYSFISKLIPTYSKDYKFYLFTFLPLQATVYDKKQIMCKLI